MLPVSENRSWLPAKVQRRPIFRLVSIYQMGTGHYRVQDFVRHARRRTSQLKYADNLIRDAASPKITIFPPGSKTPTSRHAIERLLSAVFRGKRIAVQPSYRIVSSKSSISMNKVATTRLVLVRKRARPLHARTGDGLQHQLCAAANQNHEANGIALRYFRHILKAHPVHPEREAGFNGIDDEIRCNFHAGYFTIMYLCSKIRKTCRFPRRYARSITPGRCLFYRDTLGLTPGG